MILQSSLRVRPLTTIAELAQVRAPWNALARGVPFRSFEWLESWWHSYGWEEGKELMTLAAFDASNQLVGLAPWYMERFARQRGEIHFLGSGEVCSDYLTVLARPDLREEVAQAFADWLCPPVGGSEAERPSWQLLELGGVDENDVTVKRLVEILGERDHLVHSRSRPSCWRVNLPGDWPSYLAMLSKSHRKQLRRLERDYFDSGRAALHTVETESQLNRGLALLARLHQRRRESLGERGCFASPRFADFHQKTARRLLASGNLRLAWLDLDGRTVAAEYQVLGDGVVYAYQSGIEPAVLNCEPGRLITMATLRRAIDEGQHAFDFLRGDEAYKAHWRAYSRPTWDIRVVANTASARLRHSLWLAGGSVKRWLRSGWQSSLTPGP